MSQKGKNHIQPTKTAQPVAHGNAALAQFAAPARQGFGSSAARASFPAQSGQAALSTAVAQRSKIGQDMPGLEEKEKKNKGKREKDEEEKQPLEKQETRSSKKKPVNLFRPSFSFTAWADGVSTQKLKNEQKIGFAQRAVLTRPDNAVKSVAALYDFRQQVCDTYHYAVPDETVDMEEFKQDGPYMPDYENEVIDVSTNQIVFNDNPGFSSDVKIPKDQWLENYEVRFRWLVTRQDVESGTWISPVATNLLVCKYDNGNDVKITYMPADEIKKEVVIPEA